MGDRQPPDTRDLMAEERRSGHADTPDEKWYYWASFEQAGYGPEYGDEDPCECGPFDTKEEAQDSADSWMSPFGTSEPYQGEKDR